ncbi:MAG: hypothetical protein R3B55_00095 [Candidatus Paceibacterota bacterium]
MKKILNIISPPKNLSEKEKMLTEDDKRMLVIMGNVWEHYKPISRIEKNLSLCKVSFKQTHRRVFRDGDMGNKLDILWQQVTGQKIVRYRQNEE